jgi:hypothetical protein
MIFFENHSTAPNKIFWEGGAGGRTFFKKSFPLQFLPLLKKIFNQTECSVAKKVWLVRSVR